MSDRHYKRPSKQTLHSLDLPEHSVCASLGILTLRYPITGTLIYYLHQLATPSSFPMLLHSQRCLQRLDVNESARFLLYLQNRSQFVIGFYDVLRANAVVGSGQPTKTHDSLFRLQGLASRSRVTYVWTSCHSCGVCVVVAPHGTISEAELISWCNGHMAVYKCP